jgi:hypothetical protein
MRRTVEIDIELPRKETPMFPILDHVDRLEMLRREADEYRMAREFRRRRRLERARDPAR